MEKEIPREKQRVNSKRRCRDNNMQANFFYDVAPSRPFGPVPKGFSFVVMDINVIPEGIPISATNQYLVVIHVNGGRFFTSRFIGASQTYHLTSGLVIPQGENISAQNTIFSSTPVIVELFGYFVCGEGLALETPFSPY
jgi:hypothetical protein